MTHALVRPAALALMLAGCAGQAPAPNHADQAAASFCERQADQTFYAQNRYLLSERDQRDTPFSTSGLPGVTSNGLSQRYGRDEQLAGCLKENNQSLNAVPSGSTTRLSPGSIAPSPAQ